MTDPLFDLSGQVALVTGGSRGLGREIALGLASRGASVVVASRKPEACERTAAEIRAAYPVSAWAISANVSHWEQCGELAERACAEAGQIDVLVNNAGLSPLYPSLAEVSEALYDKVLGVNLKGPFRLGALIGERMAAAGSGVIINISGPFLTDISKAWDLDAVTERLRRTAALGRAGRPDEIVGAALYLASPAASFTTGAVIKVDGGGSGTLF